MIGIVGFGNDIAQSDVWCLGRVRKSHQAADGKESTQQTKGDANDKPK